MLNPQLIIINVVGRRNLQRPGSKLTIHIFIYDDGYQPVHQGNKDLLAMEFCKPFVCGVYTNSRIPQDGLGTGGGNGYIIFFSLNPVPNIIKF